MITLFVFNVLLHHDNLTGGIIKEKCLILSTFPQNHQKMLITLTDTGVG